MGYYQGSGVVIGGSTDCRSGGSFSDQVAGQIFLTSRITTKTTKYPGVSLADAQAHGAQYDMRGGYWYVQQYSTGGGISYFNEGVVPEYSGTTTSYSYSQIGDSNLYELTKIESIKDTWRNMAQHVLIR